MLCPNDIDYTLHWILFTGGLDPHHNNLQWQIHQEEPLLNVKRLMESGCENPILTQRSPG